MQSIRTSYVFLFLIGLVWVRAPDILPPRLWAEDGAEFIAKWMSDGYQSITMPYAGYLHLVPRLTTAGLALIPMEWAALWFTLVVIVITGWSGTIIFRALGRGLPGVVGAMALIVAAGWTEPVGSVTNLQWIMGPALLVLLANTGSLGRSEGLLFAFLSSLSGPFAAIFGPIIAFIFALKLRDGKLDVVVLVAGIAGLIQGWVLLHASQSSSDAEPAEPLWLFFKLINHSLQYSLHPSVALIPLLAGCFLGEKKWQRLCLLAGILLMMLAVMVKFYHQPRVFASGVVGQRYWYIQGVLWVMIGASLLSERWRLLKYMGAVGLIVTLCLVPFNRVSREWPWPTESWHDLVVKARQGPAVYHMAPGWTLTLDLRP